MGSEIIEASLLEFPNHIIRSDGTILGLRYKNILVHQFCKQGYPVIFLKNRYGKKKRFFIHYLVASTFLGPKPKGLDTDHIDRDKTNNNLNNLRYVSRATNNFNKDGNKNNTSGYKGVAWHGQKGMWRAYIMFDYKQKHLGLFSTKEQANEARKAAEIKYNVLATAGRTWGEKG